VNFAYGELGPKTGVQVDPDAGHGGIFQFHGQFVAKALEFLER
jgi:hypothetical protein